MNCLKYHIKNERQKEAQARKEYWDSLTPEEKQKKSVATKRCIATTAMLFSMLKSEYSDIDINV